MILSGEILRGSRIREDILADRLGISRTPVREAVNRLTQNGFITSVKRKGLYCVEITRQDLLNLLELRIALESLSFENCIDQATKENIDTIQNIVEEFDKQLKNVLAHNDDNIVKELALIHNEYDVRFHVGIARISNSSRLIQYVTEVETMLLIARQRIYRSNERVKIVQVSWTQHQQMVDSIRARDKKAARALLDDHLRLMMETQVNIEY
jgi:DNA-binding GntR family transcriptional regulator